MLILQGFSDIIQYIENKSFVADNNRKKYLFPYHSLQILFGFNSTVLMYHIVTYSFVNHYNTTLYPDCQALFRNYEYIRLLIGRTRVQLCLQTSLLLWKHLIRRLSILFPIFPTLQKIRVISPVTDR